MARHTHTEHSRHGWVDLYDPPVFSEDGQSFLVRLPVRDGEEGEFKHVCLYSVRMRRVIPMTHGPFEVTEILGWDQNYNYIYYMATMEEKPGERHLYRVSDVNSPLLRIPECLSCLEGDNTTDTCLYNRAHLSPDFAFFVLECLGPDVPRTYLFSTWSGQESEKRKKGERRSAQVVTQGATVRSEPKFELTPILSSLHFKLNPPLLPIISKLTTPSPSPSLPPSLQKPPLLPISKLTPLPTLPHFTPTPHPYKFTPPLPLHHFQTNHPLPNSPSSFQPPPPTPLPFHTKFPPPLPLHHFQTNHPLPNSPSSFQPPTNPTPLPYKIHPPPLPPSHPN
ncbi:Inactive dipeptidyl peptidase 10 [Penaeus vannamei]|uniref:Inactive dipeptidyl peptidase 10 n=1 Tax=Penaeus vannamei TaxID=6689 RepID=A0A423TCE9_PENVA|nr:Inactive dipeptidyl peptidase 10 [Penaeus vannamei]